MKLNRAIGVIDSGVGGLTVAKELIRQLPKERIIYLEIQHVVLMVHVLEKKYVNLRGNDRAFTRFKY